MVSVVLVVFAPTPSEHPTFLYLEIMSDTFIFQADDGIRDGHVTGVQTCALPIWRAEADRPKIAPGPGRAHNEVAKMPTDPAARISLVILPYDAVRGSSLVELLIDELSNGCWSRFTAAVAYARASANWDTYLNALDAFGRAGNAIELTFGANDARDDPGTDLEVIRTLVTRLMHPSTAIYLYHELGRLFHPKLYLFDNE